jgi:hypothetical protein
MTTVQLTVTTDPETERLARVLVSSLPLSMALSSGAADIAIVGGSEGWVDRALGAAAASANVVIVDPSPTDSADLDRLRAAKGTSAFTIDESFAGNSAVCRLRETESRLLSDAHLVTIVSRGRSLTGMLFEQLRILRALGWADVRVRDAEMAPNSMLITAHAQRGDTRVLLRLVAAVSDTAREHRVRAYTTQDLVMLDLPDADTARPAWTEIVSPDGARILPAIYESAHRSTWRQVHARAVAGGDDGTDLEALAADMALVSQIADDGGRGRARARV